MSVWALETQSARAATAATRWPAATTTTSAISATGKTIATVAAEAVAADDCLEALACGQEDADSQQGPRTTASVYRRRAGPLERQAFCPAASADLYLPDASRRYGRSGDAPLTAPGCRLGNWDEPSDLQIAVAARRG